MESIRPIDEAIEAALNLKRIKAEAQKQRQCRNEEI